jgi:hypothetical protein
MFGIAGTGKRRKAAVNSWGYRIHDGAAQFRFELEGALASGNVAELDQCWRTARSTIAGKTLVVDVTSLTAVDETGRRLLDRWREAGAHFVGGPESTAFPGGASSRPAGRRDSRCFQPSFRTALPWVVMFLSLVLPASVIAADSAKSAFSADFGTAPKLALSRYFSGLAANRPWGAENVEIDASLPKLKEHGRLRGIRRLLPLGKPQYQVFELDGSRTVKQQVIARYLTAEVGAAELAPSSVAVSPANYQFRFVGSVGSDEELGYAFEITPRKKREGLIQGVLWIDAETGAAIRLSGYLVKRPSIFVKRVDVTRETSLRNGVAESRVTHLALETRLVGRAELTIRERPCDECTDPSARGSN